MSCVSVSVDASMESDEEFVCSQVSHGQFDNTQSSDYGMDIVDRDDEKKDYVVSLENGLDVDVES